MADRHIVTANRTADGSVVYLDAGRVWTSTVARAAVFEDDAARDAALAWAREQEHDVCDPYVLAVGLSPDGQPVVSSARERIRAGGPHPVLERLGLAR